MFAKSLDWLQRGQAAWAALPTIAKTKLLGWCVGGFAAFATVVIGTYERMSPMQIFVWLVIVGAGCSIGVAARIEAQGRSALALLEAKKAADATALRLLAAKREVDRERAERLDHIVAEHYAGVDRIVQETKPRLVIIGVELQRDEVIDTRDGPEKGDALVVVVRNEATNLLGSANHVTADIEFVGSARITTALWLHEKTNAVDFAMNSVQRVVVAMHLTAPNLAVTFSDLRDGSMKYFATDADRAARVTRHLINHPEIDVVVRIQGGPSNPEVRYKFVHDAKGLHLIKAATVATR